MKKIAILGLGNVGSLAAIMLHDSGFEVIGVDQHITDNKAYETRQIDLNDAGLVTSLFNEVDAVLSCLPYDLNAKLAVQACDAGIHYFDLTEDVPTTQSIIELSKRSRGLMAPQCGLAPGFVGIVGSDLIGKFDMARNCRMRVGALPQNPTGLMGYAFNWSPAGVVNEYLNDCEVIEGGERKTLSSMEWHETIYIDGMELEAFTTSGGLGTMCETFHGKVANLDYKTMRYPGHMKLMNFFFHELLMRQRREEAGEILVHAKPPVKDDIVYVHISCEGEQNGRAAREEFVRGYRPKMIAGEMRTAIAWTTAASVVAVIEMVRDGKLPNTGFLKQEDISFDDFIATPTGALYASEA